jgi:hypothetical protein
VADRPAGPERGQEPHDEHDALLIAAWVARDTDPGEAAQAAAQAAGCVECRALADDLRAIQAATAALPAPERTRDYRLTPAGAARLRSRRGWLDPFRPGATGRLRPLAAAMTAIGLAGLLVTTLPITGPRGGSGAAVSRPAAEAGGTMMAVQVSAAAAAPASAEAAAPASAEAAASGAGPAAASGNDTQQVGESTVPRGADRSAGLFGASGREPDEASPPGVDSAVPPAVAPAANPDLLRPAVMGASLVLVVGGLALLLVTGRARARREGE